MKKIICILLCVLLLTGCAKTEPAESGAVPGGTENAIPETDSAVSETESTEEVWDPDSLKQVSHNKAVEKTSSAVLMQAMKRAGDAADAELGTGVYAAELTEEGVLAGESVEVYPYFAEGKLDALLFCGRVTGVTEDEAVLQEVENVLDQDFMIVYGGTNLVLVSPERITRIWSTDDAADSSGNKQLQTLQEKEMKKNPFGNKRLPVGKSIGKAEVLDPSTGRAYSNSRIVVTLKESSDEVIQKIVEELGVELFRKQNQGKICIFTTTEPTSFAALKALAEKAMTIDGVEKAVLDGVSSLQVRAKNRPISLM